MDPYALKSPNELLTLFARMDGKADNTYICKYIEEILENKGYDIVIEGNEYRLEPHIPVKGKKLYAMPIEELMALYHKLVNKTGTQHIPDKLRKTLIRRVNSILINRGCVTHKETITPVIFESLKEAMEYSYLTGNNDWVVMSAMNEMCKENVKSNKEKSMKNIFIKFENELLVKYVATELRNKLGLTQVAPKATIPGAKYCGLLIRPNTITEFRYGIIDIQHSIPFTITKAANADIIIEEVIKEYNKPDFKSFDIGGAYNGNTINVRVFKDKVIINAACYTHEQFTMLYNTSTNNWGGYKLGGSSVILFTGSYDSDKVYVTREQLDEVFNSVVWFSANG